jgi:hypothetical protein
MSGKRNNLEDLGIVEVEGSRALRSYDGQFDPSAGLSPALFQHVLHSQQDQLLRGAAVAGRAAFQPPIHRVRNIHRRSHTRILPYLWPIHNRRPMWHPAANSFHPRDVKIFPPFAEVANNGHLKNLGGPASTPWKAGSPACSRQAALRLTGS